MLQELTEDNLGELVAVRNLFWFNSLPDGVAIVAL